MSEYEKHLQRVYQQLDGLNARLGRIEHLWANERKRLESEAAAAGARQHQPCIGDAGGEWVHCRCHDEEGCLWGEALKQLMP